MESRKNGIDDLICKAEIKTHREQTYGYEGGNGNVGWIGSMGLAYIYYYV